MDTTDWSGFSALHYAARRSAVSFMRLLVDSGANPNPHPHPNQVSCVRLLVDAGADKSLVAASGEQAHDLASDPEIQRMLKPGLKRRRSLSSTNALALEQDLP